MIVEYSNNLHRVYNLPNIVYKLNGFEFNVSQNNSPINFVEYIHIKKGHTLIVIDISLTIQVKPIEFINIGQHGKLFELPNDDIDCDDYMVRTNSKDIGKITKLLEKAMKHDNIKDKPVCQMLEGFKNVIKELPLEAIYNKHPDTSIKTLSFIAEDKNFYDNKLVLS